MNPLKPSATPSAKTTSTAIKASRLHALGWVLLSACLLMAIIQSQLSAYAFILVPGLLYYIYDHHQHHFGAKRVKTIAPQANGLWMLNGVGGYRLLHSSSIRRYWAILYFKPSRLVAIFPDSLPKDDFRQLRKWLRNGIN